MNDFDKHLTENRITNAAAAQALSVTEWHVSRLRNGLTPSMKLAQRIARWTDGAVPVGAWDDEAAA